jgi:hypothetical protein
LKQRTPVGPGAVIQFLGGLRMPRPARDSQAESDAGGKELAGLCGYCGAMLSRT